MKNLFTFLILINTLITTILSAQTYSAEDIFKKSIEAVSKIDKGSYKIDFRMKFFDRKDTLKLSGICYFEKDKNIKYGAKLNIQQKSGINHIYNGKEIYYLTENDSTALLINTKKFGYSYIDGNVVSELIYAPIIKESINKIANNKDIQIINFEPDTIINKNPCYKINIKFKDDGEFKNIVTAYFIDKETYIPIKKISNLDWQTQHQYKEHNISEISINSLPVLGSEVFEKSSIPVKYSQIYFNGPTKKSKEEMNLPPGNLAPDFQLKSLNNEDKKLKNLQGKLVLLDFSYQACYGCKLALPELQKLYEKYKEKGLEIVGINPVDTSVNDYKKYLDQRNISFPFCITSKEIAVQYKVQAYPTFYLIDPNGKIILSDIGYSEKQFAKLEKKIQKQLKIMNKSKK